MIHRSAHPRTSFGISPLLVIALIFLAVLTVEGLLAARFWIQLAAVDAPDGITRAVLDLTHPLVAPFADAQESAQQQVGSFERKTLLAGMAYLIGGVGLTMLTVLTGSLISGRRLLVRRQRRGAMQQMQHSMIDHSGARLLGTATLNISPEQTTRVMRMLHLDCLGAELFVIPAAGGCIVAAFASPETAESHVPLLGRIGATREAIAVRRALRALEERHQLASSSSAAFDA
jgi:hypothetical protein